MTVLRAKQLILLIAMAANLHSPAAAESVEGHDAIPGSLFELLDLRSMPLRKSWRTHQQSSHDPGGGFYDSGHFPRIEEGNQLVALDATGPGCIDRMWFTRKRPWQEPYELRVFIDDREEPALRSDLDALFSGTQSPFVAPLAGTCGLDRTPALFSLVPLGFEKRCKVVLVPTAPDQQYLWRTDASGSQVRHVYYQITWRSLEPGSPVRVWQTPLDDNERKALRGVSRMWNRVGESPWAMSSLSERTRKTAMREGEAEDLFRLDGPAVIYALRLSIHSGDRPIDASALEAVFLEMTWDEAPAPQIQAPLSAIFGYSGASGEIHGLWCGCRDDRFYMYLPMPFARTARIRVRNTAATMVSIDASLQLQVESPRAADGRLAALRYDFPSPAIGRDNVPLEIDGTGHVVGVVMDRPGHTEGDDRWFVDGSSEPRIAGTGTEDFFNFAWGLGANQMYAQHGMARAPGGPWCYRFLFPAGIPFRRSIKLAWEHGHTLERGPNQHAARYSGLIFVYLVP